MWYGFPAPKGRGAGRAKHTKTVTRADATGSVPHY